MKNIALLSTFCFLLLSLVVKSQTPPNAFNYSAVARNAAGQPIATTTIGVQISILKTSATGSVQYSENHFVNTDAFGLFNLVIGTGAVQSGAMATINWSNDNYYLKVGMDATGGTNFLTMGTTQLLSVPYALYAKSAGSVIGGGTGSNFTHYIGEEFGGGLIFYLWKDAQGVEHGLIVDKTELSTSQVWSNTNGLSSALSSWDGLSNSNAIVAQAGHTNSAAALCLSSTNGGQSDWYLPSVDEMDELLENSLILNSKLRSIGGATEIRSVGSFYWTSTERDGGTVYTDRCTINIKTNQGPVRAIRAF